MIEEDDIMVPFLYIHRSRMSEKFHGSIQHTRRAGIDQKQSEAKEYDILAFALAKMRHLTERRALQEYADPLHLMAYEAPPPFQHLPMMTLLDAHHHVAQVPHPHHHNIYSNPLDPFHYDSSQSTMF